MTPPILGIFASAVTGGVSTNSYESIATVTVGSGGSSTVEFTSIPGTYQHLQIRILSGSDGSAGSGSTIRFNSDTTTTNYYDNLLYGNGSSASAADDADTAYAPQFTGGAMSTSPAASIIDIVDYANTNKNKVFRMLNGYDANGSGLITVASGLWKSTSAITSIKFTAPSTKTFNQYSHFALYGIKAAS